MLHRHVPVRASTIGGWVGAGCDFGGVGDVARNEFPDFVGDHKAESTCNVVLGT
jgi:hypothetical protein